MAGIKGAVSLRIQFHWGYSVKEPIFTASQPPFRIPPQSTLIGALSYPISVRKRPEIEGEVSEAIQTLKLCPWVTYRFLDDDPSQLIETMDINRVSLSLGVRSEHLNPRTLWGIQPHGKIYAPSSEMEVVYFTRDPDFVGERAWGIVRVGTKESLVSVEEVEVREVSPIDSEEIEILHLTPLDIVTSPYGSYMIVRLPELRPEWYELRLGRGIDYKRYILPLNSVRVSLKDAVALRDSAGNHYALPRGLIGNA
jgi:CRISPR-associated protein Cas5a/b/c